VCNRQSNVGNKHLANFGREQKTQDVFGTAALRKGYMPYAKPEGSSGIHDLLKAPKRGCFFPPKLKWMFFAAFFFPGFLSTKKLFKKHRGGHHTVDGSEILLTS